MLLLVEINETIHQIMSSLNAAYGFSSWRRSLQAFLFCSNEINNSRGRLTFPSISQDVLTKCVKPCNNTPLKSPMKGLLRMHFLKGDPTFEMAKQI